MEVLDLVLALALVIVKSWALDLALRVKSLSTYEYDGDFLAIISELCEKFLISRVLLNCHDFVLGELLNPQP